MDEAAVQESSPEELRRRRRVAIGGAVVAASIAAVGVGLPLIGEPPIQPPLSAFNFLLLALVHLADEDNSILRVPPKMRILVTFVPLAAATLAGLWMLLQWPFDVCTTLWPLPTDMQPTPACVGAVWLIAASRLLSERPRWTRLSALLGIAALPPALVSLIGWAFGPTLVSTVATPLHLRLPAALGVLALVAARMATPLHAMPYRWLLGDSPTAIWLRRLSLATLLLIPSLMLLHDHAVEVGWYQPHAAAMISTVLMLGVGFTGILWSAGRLHRAESLLRAAHAELEQRVADRTHELALANEALNRDIQERRRMDEQLRASRERLRAVTESAIDPILTVDAFGQIVQWNQAATNVFDYPESAILGAKLELLLPELAPAGDGADFSARVASWLGHTQRCIGRRSNGEVVDLEVSLAMWSNRENRFYSIIGRDVTARTRAEQELTEARDAAEAANRSKSQFLANMSHEIRTPMNVILGMTELIGTSDLTEDQRRYLRSTRDAGDHLLEIINDILDLSKVEAGALTLDEIEFDVRELAEQAVEFLAPRAYGKKLEIVCHLDPALPPAVVGDPQRLRQVLVNLLGNAVKFTDVGSVELFVDVAGPETLRFAVVDTGCGIPADKLGVIFDSFTQVDSSSTRKYGGTGLGLAISRQLVERMSGRLRVESTVEVGSTFQLEIALPFRQRDVSSVVAELAQDPVLAERVRSCRAIVAGGQAVFRHAAGVLLAQLGVVVTELESVSTLLLHLRTVEAAGRPCDLLLLDADMGAIDGYEAARQVNALGLKHPPRIALTKPREEADDQRRRRECGVAAVVRKPLRQKALLNALAQLLGTRGADVPATHERKDMADTTPRSLLIVDDASDNLRLMEAFLRETGWHVETAEDGSQAVQRWRERAFDVILMDVQMPVMDGLTATRTIRQLEQEQGRAPTPIIAVTAHALDEARADSFKAGCTAFLAKPLRRARLLETLTELFQGQPRQEGVDLGPIEVEVDPLLLTLIPGFLEHRRDDITAIAAALEAENFETIQLLGHSMKGSGGSYGFEVISHIGREFEIAARDRDAATVRHTLGTLQLYLQRLRVK